MKKILCGLLVLLLLCAAGCTAEVKPVTAKKGQALFLASIEEVYDGSMLVTVITGEGCGLTNGDPVSVPTELDSGETIPAREVGDLVTVVFDGIVMETYPLQIGRAFAVVHTDAQMHPIGEGSAK